MSKITTKYAACAEPDIEQQRFLVPLFKRAFARSCSITKQVVVTTLMIVSTVLVSVSTAQENDADSNETGVIVGSVFNAVTGRYLERAVVRIEGTTMQTLTSREGGFRLVVPPGTHQVVASYLNLRDISKTVTVPMNEQIRIDMELRPDSYDDEDIFQLDSFVVSAVPDATAHAITQQRRSESQRSVTSVDAFINQTVGNPAEFLKNVQGIQMDYLFGEPQNIRVRGFDPSLTVVTMDGNEIASAASTSTNRLVQIDQLSIGAIGGVEVYKAPVPWMSANAIGGAVNFTSQSAFDQKGHRAYVNLGFNAESRELKLSKTRSHGHGEEAERRIYPIGRLFYSNSFFDNRLGVMVSAGHDKINWIFSSAAYNVNVSALPGTSLPAAPTLYTEDNVRVTRGNLGYAPNRQLRTRDDFNLNLDFKVNDSLALFLKTTVSKYHSGNRNHSFNLNPALGASGSLSSDSTLRDYTYTSNSGRSPVNQGASVFDKYTTTWSINPGLKFQYQEWKVDLTTNFAKSTNDYKNDNNFSSLSLVVVSPSNNPISWRAIGPAEVGRPDTLEQLSGPDFYKLSSYQSNQGNLASTKGEHRANHAGIVENRDRSSYDIKKAARLDVQRDFVKGNFPFYLKAGLSYNDQIRDRKAISRRWYWMGEDGVATPDDLTPGGLRADRFMEDPAVTQMMKGWDLREPEYLDTHALWKYWQENPQVLQENLAFQKQQQFAGRQKIEEEITAAYAMGNFTFEKLNVLVGVRVEKTKVWGLTHRVLPVFNQTWETDGNPNTVNSPDAVRIGSTDPNSLQGIDLLYRWVQSDAGYTSDPFPYLHLKYELTDAIQLRASYTEAIGRPNLTNLLPTFSQNDTMTSDGYAGRISAGNPELGPQRSKNLDFSFEWYNDVGGEFTIGWFNRDVEDYLSTSVGAITQEVMDRYNLGSDYLNYRLDTTQNLGYAKWSGVELTFRQGLRSFKGLPQFLHGIELWGNATYIYQMEGDFGTPGAKIDHLSGVADKLYNLGVSYWAPGSKFYISLSNNFIDDKPTQNRPAGNANGQRNPITKATSYWNLEMKYNVTPRMSISLVATNLTKEGDRRYEFGYIGTRDQQEFGTNFVMTARYEF